MLKYATFGLMLLFVAPAWAGENCTCSYDGIKTPEGSKTCIKTSKGMEMAQCSRVLNNTSWKFLGLPCPTAQLKEPIQSGDFDLQAALAVLKKS